MNVASISSAAPIVPGLLGQPVRANQTPDAQRKSVASQFEAIMLRQFLQDSVGSMMGGGKDASGNVYGYLLTDVFAQQLSAGGGLGLSKVIQQQLTPSTPHAAAGRPAPAPVQS